MFYRLSYLIPVAAAFTLPALIFAAEPEPPAWIGLQDVHLDVTLRTAAERERIAAVLAPPEDFSAPLVFAENSAGAATVRTQIGRAHV